MSTCIARQTLACTDRLAPASTGQSSELVQQCANGMSSYSCTDFLEGNLPPECSPTGPEANGSSCAFNAQCASGFCAGNRYSNCGTCAPSPAAGDSCATSNCGHAQACIWNVQVTNVCEPYAGSGQACGAFNDPLCDTDLTCQGASTTKMTNGTCAAAVATVGSACGGKNSGLGCENRIGLVCFNDACASIAYAGDGMPCGFTGNGLTQCAGGTCYSSGGPFFTSTGDMSTGTCKAFAADGAACDTAMGPECLSPARCITSGGSTSGTCTVTSPSISATCR